MRQYYLCNPFDQAISGPHPLSELILQAQSGAITPEWFVAEPGSEKFTVLAESFMLNEILFKGGVVPVDPPPVVGFKLRGGSPKPETTESGHPPDEIKHHAEFAKVIERTQLAPKPKPKPVSLAKPAHGPSQTPNSPQGALTPENVLSAAREDFTRVLKKHDDDHFDPPTYWKSSAGERMRTFLYAEMFVFIFALIILGFFVLINKVTIVLLLLLLGAVVMLTVGLAFLVFLMMS